MPFFILGNTSKKQERIRVLRSMNSKENKPVDLNNLEEKEKLKYEIAEELGLLDKVKENGWRALSSKETGRIGGLITKRKRLNGERK